MLLDHEFDPVTPEEAARREQDEALARAVRREIRRVGSGEAAEQMRREADEEHAARREERLRNRRTVRRSRSTFWQLFSGTILVRDEVSKYYPYMVGIAGMFLISIACMFWTLHLDITYSRLEREVQLRHERAMRLEEQRCLRTTHSAIVGELRRRGIALEDPAVPAVVIE